MNIKDFEPCKKCLYYLECNETRIMERVVEIFREGYDYCFYPKYFDDEE